MPEQPSDLFELISEIGAANAMLASARSFLLTVRATAVNCTPPSEREVELRLERHPRIFRFNHHSI